MPKENIKVIIPARKGSKRFPGKNKVLLHGIPLVQHSINYAIQSGIPLTNIWVNSDDEEILEIAASLHVQSYHRNSDLAGDLTSTAEVLKDQLAYFSTHGISCESMILLQVTNPLRPKGLLDQALGLFLSGDRSSLCTFSTLNKKFGLIENNYFKPQNYLPGQRMQDITPAYFENGLLYISSSKLIEQGVIIGEDVFPLVVDHPFANVDIDEPEDLIFAKYLIENQINETF